MTPSILCATLEVGLNRYLRLDEDALAECAKLDGRAMELRVTGPEWSFFIEFYSGGVRVMPEHEGEADVSVAAAPAVLARLAFKTLQGDSGLPAGLRVQGDPELLTRFNALLSRIGFDPQELLAPIVGAAAAQRVTQGLGGLLGWTRKTAGTLALDTAEYLREETRDLARREDVEEWMDAVERLREGTDRLEARLSRLEKNA